MKRFYSYISILMTVVILTCCTAFQETRENKDFTAFTENLFCTEVNSDSLTLNYTLAHPEEYGITNLPGGFSSFTYEDLASGGPAYENLLAQLESYDTDSLSFQQQVLYDTLHDTLETDIQGCTFAAFSESLGPTTGIQAQLPVLLAEFRIEDKNDLEQYFLLLETIPDYFSSLLSLEQKKSGLGTLPCRSTIEHIISQCREFLQAEGFSMLTDTFKNKSVSFSFLNDQEKAETLSRHDDYIRRFLTPAYQTLADGLAALLPDASEDGSLSSRPEGSRYYSYLVRHTTGSTLSVDELNKLLTEKLSKTQNTLMEYARQDPSLFRTCQRYISDYPTADSILTTLQSRMLSDFPEAADSTYEIKYVAEALEDYLSPAFYLTPPVDDSTENVIYINNADRYDRSSLFNTLAHEGYPGHLYQTCYMHSKNLPSLRYLLEYGGYTEGWATYAEIYSYKYTGISKSETGILRNNMIFSLCLYALCDLGVHGYGWKEDDLIEFLNQYGTWGQTTAKSIYSAVVDEPASYLKYTVGYLEFTRLKEYMKEELGDAYSEKIFHTYVLDMGPTSFDILKKYISRWQKEKQLQ